MKVSIHHCKSLFFGLGIVLAWIHCVSVLGLAGMGQLSFSLALAGFFAGILKGSQYQKKLSWSLQGAQFILMGICCVIYLIVSLFFQSLSQSLIFLPMLFGSGLVPTKNRPFQDLIGIGITAFFLILFYTQIRYTNDAALAALLLSNWFFFDALCKVFPLPGLKSISFDSMKKEIQIQGKQLWVPILRSFLLAGPVLVCGQTRSIEETGMYFCMLLLAGFYIFCLERIPLSLRREVNHLLCFLGLGLGLLPGKEGFELFRTIGHLFWLCPGLVVLNRLVLQKHHVPSRKISFLVEIIFGLGSIVMIPWFGLWGSLVLAGIAAGWMSGLTMQKLAVPSFKEMAKVFPCLMGALVVWIFSALLMPGLWGQCGLILIYILIAVGGQMVIVRSKW